MKNNKRIILLISLLASLCSISGCSNSIDSSLPIDITSEDISESSNIHEDPSGNSINDSISEQNKDFEGIVFKNKTFTYDGKIHRVEVENLPEFANVSYVNNDQIEIGTYTVKAIISAKGYNETTLKAKLIIEAIEFKGLKFEDQTFEYDEKPHSIYVENLPDFASVTYTNNNQIYEGVYTVSAKVSAKNYKSVTLTARMTIAKMMPLIDIGDRTLIYNGDNQLVRIEFPNLPYRTTYSYKVDGKTVESENDLRVKTIGTHTVSVTLSNDYYDYLPRTSTAIINIIPNTLGGVDTSKECLEITKDIKYKTLKDAILKGNFTLKEEIYDDYFYPDGREECKLDSINMIYVVDGEAFEFYDYCDIENNYYQLSETTYKHTKIIGDEVYSCTYEEGVLNDYELKKFPKEAYRENVIGDYGCRAISYLKEESNGNIANSEEGGFVTTYGSYEIDTINNAFIMNSRAHYYHPEFNHDERVKYTIYNIGNTTLNVPENLKVDNIDKTKFNIASYRINGVSYSIYGDYALADIVLDSRTCAYLEEGVYILPAYFEGLPVLEFSTSYYSKYYDQDCSKYTYKCYFNSSGYYQDIYEDLGRVSGTSDLYLFIDDGGNILYYEDWH